MTPNNIRSDARSRGRATLPPTTAESVSTLVIV
jgi:hypothetical protein